MEFQLIFRNIYYRQIEYTWKNKDAKMYKTRDQMYETYLMYEMQEMFITYEMQEMHEMHEAHEMQETHEM